MPLATKPSTKLAAIGDWKLLLVIRKTKKARPWWDAPFCGVIAN